MRGFSPLLFRLYASDLSDAIYALSRERQMGISQLRAEIGADLTMRPGQGGKTEIYELNGIAAEVRAGSSASQIAAALSNPPKTEQQVMASADQLPPVTVASAPRAAPVATGGFAASLKAMLDQARAGVTKAQSDGLAKVQAAVGKLNAATTHISAVSDSTAKSIEDQANSVLAELGQISNMPPEDQQ